MSSLNREIEPETTWLFEDVVVCDILVYPTGSRTKSTKFRPKTRV